MTSAIVSALTPYLLEILGSLLLALIGWAAARFSAWSGIQIEARHREALHSALMTGAQIAIGRGLPQVKAAELAVAYAQQSVPEAMARLRPSGDVLTNLARAKLFEIAGPGAS